MTKEELARLVEIVAEKLAKANGGGTWLPTPPRPEPPADPTPGSLPVWAASAQRLGDVAPSRRGSADVATHRVEYPALVAASRQAAAARGPSPQPAGSSAGAEREASKRSRREVKIGVSARHIHVSPRDFEALFGKGRAPSVMRTISQPGQFAAAESVTVTGPKGAIEGVRIVGPARGSTQVELSPSDARELGVEAPVRMSGRLDNTPGLTLEGPAGKVTIQAGVIVAQRHLHVAPADGRKLGVADGDRVSVEAGPAGRRAILHDVLVRLGPTHATELHLDLDEANAAMVKSGDVAVLLGRTAAPAAGKKRPLLTERDVSALAARGEKLSAKGPWLITPAAADRARALGIWSDGT